MRNIDLIIIHCADTYPSMDIGADEIRQWHLDRNWSDIGYHYVIRRDGLVENGRDLDGDGDILEEVGAHTLGHNKNSLGICLVGGKPNFNFTYSQICSLRTVIKDLLVKIPGADVCGHYEKDSNKECPMFDVKHLLEGVI